MFDAFEQRGDLVGEIVQAKPEIPLRFRAEDLVELADAAVLRIDAVELVPEQALELHLLLIERHRRLQHLEDARLLGHAHAALPLGRLPEFHELPLRPFRADVARRDDGDEHGDALQAVDERFGEEIVALELGVAPDVRLLAEQLADTDLEGAVQVGDPPLAPFDQFLVVEMRVADERIAVEVHRRGIRGYST